MFVYLLYYYVELVMVVRLLCAYKIDVICGQYNKIYFFQHTIMMTITVCKMTAFV
jgi:hypothetical protein